MQPRYLVLAALIAACDGGDTEADKDSDTRPADSDTDVIVDSDPTDAPVETDETDVVAPLVTIRELRLALVPDVDVGSVVRVEGVTVTAVLASPSGNGFTVQEGGTTTHAGLFVDMGADDTLPAPGDVVTVTGRYVEDAGGNPAAVVPDQTRAELEVGDAVPGSSWSKTGTDTPVARAVLPTTYGQIPEAYESLLVQISGQAPLVVGSEPDADGEFTLMPPPGVFGPLRVGSTFHRAADGLPDFGPGATIASLRGIAWWSAGFELSPLSGSDIGGYAPPAVEDTDPPDTDLTDPPDTDLTDLPETDTDLPETDTDLPDTDPTDSPVPTDRPDSDTFVLADSAPDTDNGSGGPGGVVDVPLLASGAVSENRVYTVEEVVVTAVRYRTSPRASNGFVVQAPLSTFDGALYVNALDLQVLPQVGDVVTVTGWYDKWLNGGTDDIARLSIKESVNGCQPTDGCGFTVLRSGEPLPTPISLTPAQIFRKTPTTLRHALMLVTVEAAAPLRVVSSNSLITILNDGTSDLKVFEHFYNLRNDYAVGTNDTFESATGVLYWFSNEYQLTPRSADDLVGFVDN